MKKLLLFLSSLILSLGQINQGAFAIEPITGANYINRSYGKNASLNQDGIYSAANDIASQLSTALQKRISVTRSNNLVKSPIDQTLITFTEATALELGEANNPKTTSATYAFASQKNNLNLEMGNILINPENNITISTQESTISVAANAAIFVMQSELGTIIFDLYQSKSKEVIVLVNKHKLEIEPGCMLVLTKQKTDNFEELTANCHSIHYRRIQEIDLHEDSINAFAANFSVFSALVKIQPLKELVNSKDPRDSLLLHKLLKTVAMLGS